VVLGAYLKDLGVLIGIGVVIKRNHAVKLAAQVAGKTSTALQLTLVIATLLAVDIARWSPAAAGSLLWTLWWVTVWATAASGWAYSCAGARMQSAECRMQNENAEALPVFFLILHSAFCTLHFPNFG
jgi:hypothetical protein